MAKKTGKAVKAKSKPVGAKKAAAKAPVKKAAKAAKPAKAPAKKAAPAAKANTKKAAAKPVKKAAPAPKAKAAKPAPAAKAAVGKKVVEKPAKAAKPAKAIPAPKAAKAESKAKAPKVEEVEELVLDAAPEEDATDAEVFLTDAEGRRYCRVKDCDQLAAVDSYCRYHYLALWKKIQVRKKILSEGKLERYIEELTARYPDKFLEMLRKDLRSEKEFLSAIQELEIDENAVDNEFEDEAQNYIDEVRGMEPAAREDEDF